MVRGKGTLLIDLRSLHGRAVDQRQLHGALERKLLGREGSADRSQEYSDKDQNSQA
jgi:hypothetical protein